MARMNLGKIDLHDVSYVSFKEANTGHEARLHLHEAGSDCSLNKIPINYLLVKKKRLVLCPAVLLIKTPKPKLAVCFLLKC